MKKLIFITLLLCSLNSIQAQYCPLLEEDKHWFFKMIYGESGGAIHGAYILNIQGDTVVNNTNYKILYRQDLKGEHNCQFPPCFSINVPFEVFPRRIYTLLREDTTERKVYCLPQSQPQYVGDEEFLLFDFNLMEGETMSPFIMDFINYNMEPNLGIVDSITIETHFEKERRVTNTTGLIPTSGLGFFDQLKLIEGIGLERIGFFPNNQEYMFDLCIGDYNDCNIISSNHEIFEDLSLTVAPNPTADVINVSSSKTIGMISLYDLTGRNLATYKDSEIDLSPFANGFYFLKVTFKDKTIKTERVIKN